MMDTASLRRQCSANSMDSENMFEGESGTTWAKSCGTEGTSDFRHWNQSSGLDHVEMLSYIEGIKYTSWQKWKRPYFGDFRCQVAVPAGWFVSLLQLGAVYPVKLTGFLEYHHRHRF